MMLWRSRSRLSAANVFGGIGSPSGVRKVPRRSAAALSFGLKLANTEPDECRLEPGDNAAGFTNERLAFPARALGVLFGKRRHQDHLAMPAFATQPAEKATLQKLRIEPIGLRPAVFARDRDTRCMNDVDLDAECGEPARQPETVVSGLERDGNACDLVPFLLGLLLPTAQQLQQRMFIDRDLLQRLALDTRNKASD